MIIQDIHQELASLISDTAVIIRENCTPETIEVPATHLKVAMNFLHSDPRLYFDMLSCLTGLDLGEESGQMEVIYHLCSIPKGLSLAIAVKLERTDPMVSTVSDIWRTANWHERETYDLLGIHFDGHPDLRRILLPNDWEGYPLRKDYQHQEYYHGMKVEY